MSASSFRGGAFPELAACSFFINNISSSARQLAVASLVGIAVLLDHPQNVATIQANIEVVAVVVAGRAAVAADVRGVVGIAVVFALVRRVDTLTILNLFVLVLA